MLGMLNGHTECFEYAVHEPGNAFPELTLTKAQTHMTAHLSNSLVSRCA